MNPSHMLTFAPLCEHHSPHRAQQHVQMFVAQLNFIGQSVSDKRPQGDQPVGIIVPTEPLPLAEEHHHLAQGDVQGQRLHHLSWDRCGLLTPEGVTVKFGFPQNHFGS